jgi:glutamate N-acetyltransferase/amino-acid N-acetyltransferase
LLKCAIYGEDPNWGRVLAAVGVTDATFEPFAIDVAFNGVAVCTAGEPGADRSLVTFDGRGVSIDIELHAGSESATVWTNDLTVDYVHENSAYST